MLLRASIRGEERNGQGAGVLECGVAVFFYYCKREYCSWGKGIGIESCWLPTLLGARLLYWERAFWERVLLGARITGSAARMSGVRGQGVDVAGCRNT